MRINLPAGGPPTAVTFAEDATSVVVATSNLSGCSLYMYAEEKTKPAAEAKQQPKLPGPEIKWQHHKVHEKRAILTLFGATASYGTADGSTVVASCSEGIHLSCSEYCIPWALFYVIFVFEKFHAIGT